MRETPIKFVSSYHNNNDIVTMDYGATYILLYVSSSIYISMMQPYYLVYHD